MEFSELELDERLLRAAEDLGYRKPTVVQREVIPEALAGHDVLADAPTGTGKTAAFVLPCLQHLIDFSYKRHGLSRILVLTPTRELALQVHEQVRLLAKYLPRVTSGAIIGGVDHEEQLPDLGSRTDVVVATPGRLREYLRKKLFDIKGVEILVLDEADRMLDMGFYDDVTAIAAAASRREQTFLFSATLEGELLAKFANEVLENPVEIRVDSPRSEKKKIAQYAIYADSLEHKTELLKHLLKSEKIVKAVVFVKTRERLRYLAAELDREGIGFAYLRGEMDQARRLEALEKFAADPAGILLATDVAARGLDVADVTHVINFDMPRGADVYVHRIGRTARAGRKGVAINLVEAHDVPMLGKAERYTGERIVTRVVEGLRAKNRIAVFAKKKKKDRAPEKAGKAAAAPRPKIRERDRRNKGRPDFREKKLRKLMGEGMSAEEALKALGA